MNDNANAGNGENNNNNANAGAGNGEAGANNNANAGSADDQGKKTDNANAPFDTAKISDADFEKIFDDPRTFNHSRFKDLNELAKKGKAADEAEAKRQQEEAVRKGDFDKVLGEKDGKITELQTIIKTQGINAALTIAASKLNAVDIDAVLALVDRSKISVEDSGKVSGIEDALKTLQTSKAYLFGKQGTQRLGSGANPNQADTGELRRFKHSQIIDPVFYRANEKDILASQKAGLIENDL